MRRTALLVFVFFFATMAFGHPRFMYINVEPVSCQNYTYNVEFNYSQYAGSDILMWSMEVKYGDGEYAHFSVSDGDIMLVRDDQALYKITQEHSYPGPGEYKITVEHYRRDAGIMNMTSSVNTSLFVETTITIDPYMGCNQTPKLENMPIQRNKQSVRYFNDFSFVDKENDSLSFHFTTPLRDENLLVTGYWMPVEKDQSQVRNISKISMDPYNCSLSWNLKGLSGTYTVAMVVDEWRKVEGEYYKISSSTMDYLIDIQDTDNNFPEIPELQDTAIIAGNRFTKTISVFDPDGDSLFVNAYGDFFHLMDLQPKEYFDFVPGPVEVSMDFTPFSIHVRPKPYKVIYSSNDKVKDFGSLNNTKSMYIWITDRDHEPEAPENFIGQAISKNLINIYWNDSNDELGYIVERADSYFQEFERLVVLPANATYFNDSSVIENNTYQYRITAVGTKMSAKKSIEVTTPDIITGITEKIHGSGFTIYPNPNNGSFRLSNLPANVQLVIKDLSGKDVFKKQVDLSEKPDGFMGISTNLTMGIYLVQVNSISYKMIVN